MAWRVWGGVSYFIEESVLQSEGKPAPNWWNRDHWRTFVRIKRLVEQIRAERVEKEGKNGH